MTSVLLGNSKGVSRLLRRAIVAWGALLILAGFSNSALASCGDHVQVTGTTSGMSADRLPFGVPDPTKIPCSGPSCSAHHQPPDQQATAPITSPRTTDQSNYLLFVASTELFRPSQSAHFTSNEPSASDGFTEIIFRPPRG